MVLKVDYLIVSNGLQHYCCRIDYEHNSYTSVSYTHLDVYKRQLSDSFQDNLLAAPVYTRPADYNGWKVPDILLSGHEALSLIHI